MHLPNASSWQFESQSAPTSSKIVFGVNIITIVPYSRCNLLMSSGEKDSLNLGFPYLFCYVSVIYNISAMAGQSLIKNLYNEVKIDV